MKNAKLRLSAALLALIMCFGLLVSCGDSGITVASVEKDPYAAVMDGAEKYKDSLDAKYGDVYKVHDKLKEGAGTYDIALSIPDQGDVTLSAAYDPATGAFSGKGAIGAEGMSMDLSVWGDKNNIALSAPFILGEAAYGVKLDTIEDDLANSELLSSVAGVSLDELKGSLETELGMTWDEVKGMVSPDSWKTAYDKLVADCEAIIKDKTAVVAEENVKIGDKDVAAVSVQYTFTKDDMNKIVDASVAMVDSVIGKLLTASGVDLKEEMNSAMAEAGVEEISADITAKYYLAKKDGALIGVDTNVGEDVKISLIYGEDVSKTIDMSANITATVEGETVEIAATIKEVTDEGKGGLNIDATVKAAGEEHTVNVTAVRNDADGKCEVKLSADGEEIGTIAGSLTYSADEVKLTVDSITSMGESTPVGLTLSAKAGGTVEAVPEYTNIITASAEELQGIVTAVSSLIDSIDFSGLGSYEDFGSYEDVGGEGEITIEDLMEGMTEEEIAQFYQDLEDLGMTTDDILNMLG